MKENERVFDRVMFQKIAIGHAKCRVVDLAFAACVLVLALLVRICLLPIESADYYGFLKPWMDQIREKGGFASLGVEISNYTSPYMYIMCLLSYFGNDLVGLKAVSILFDYAAALTVLMIVYRLTGSVRRGILGMTFLLFSPAVIIDGAYWAQCDIIYCAFILLALYGFFRKNSAFCLVFLGVSFAFKLQALFIVPFLLIMWAKRRTVLLRHFLWVPVIYVLSAVPAWLMGRNFWDLMTIYFRQSGMYPWGTLAYPNMYALLDEVMTTTHHAAEVSGSGMVLTVMLLGGIAYFVYTKKVRLTDKFVVSLALLTVSVTVYTLPHMHDRYGFLIDLLALLYAMLDVRKLWLYFGFSLISVITFMPYLIAVNIVPIQYTAIGLLALILLVGYDVYRQACELSEPPEEPCPERTPGELSTEETMEETQENEITEPGPSPSGVSGVLPTPGSRDSRR